MLRGGGGGGGNCVCLGREEEERGGRGVITMNRRKGHPKMSSWTLDLTSVNILQSNQSINQTFMSPARSSQLMRAYETCVVLQKHTDNDK